MAEGVARRAWPAGRSFQRAALVAQRLPPPSIPIIQRTLLPLLRLLTTAEQQTLRPGTPRHGLKSNLRVTSSAKCRSLLIKLKILMFHVCFQGGLGALQETVWRQFQKTGHLTTKSPTLAPQMHLGAAFHHDTQDDANPRWRRMLSTLHVVIYETQEVDVNRVICNSLLVIKSGHLLSPLCARHDANELFPYLITQNHHVSRGVGTFMIPFHHLGN